MIDKIRQELISRQEITYRDFQARLMPTVSKEKIIGVRTPVLRAYSKSFSENEKQLFMQQLPHRYYEEYNLHALFIKNMKNAEMCLE